MIDTETPIDYEQFSLNFPPPQTNFNRLLSKDSYVFEIHYFPPFLLLTNTNCLMIKADDLLKLYKALMTQYNEIVFRSYNFQLMGRTFYLTKHQENLCIFKDGEDFAVVIVGPFQDQTKIITIGVIEKFSLQRLKYIGSLLQFDRTKLDYQKQYYQ